MIKKIEVYLNGVPRLASGTDRTVRQQISWLILRHNPMIYKHPDYFLFNADHHEMRQSS